MYYFHLSITILYALDNVFRSEEKCLSYTNRGECKECFPGFFGIDCSHTCPYPTYGSGCQNVCQCDRQKCKPIMGCTEATDCHPGYFGIDCIHECQFPNYGINCQHVCACNVPLCNKETGCQISTTEIQSKDSTYEIEMLLNSITTKDFKRNLPEINTASVFSKFVNLMTYAYQENWSFHTSEITLKPPNEAPAFFVDHFSRLFDINNPFTISLVTGILFLVITLCVVLCKCHRRFRLGTTSETDIENQLQCIHYQQTETETEPFEDSDKNYDLVLNDITSFTGSYETIDISSDDSELNGLSVEVSDINNRKSQRKLPADLDTDEYMCPSTSKRSMKNSCGETRDDSYLTVL